MKHDSDRCKDHMDKRRKGVLAAVPKITTLGFSNDLMHIKLKAEMFNVHIRPIIMRCKSTDLFLSFGMMPTQERINWLKLKHYGCLIKI